MIDYFDQIIRHAHSRPQEEVCGFLRHKGLSLEAVPMPNEAQDPSRNFLLPSGKQLELTLKGELAAYYHSHWNETEAFSLADIESSEEALLPLFVFSLRTGKFNMHMPAKLRRELLNRRFVLGLSDCVTLVSDYYASKNIRFPYFARFKHLLTGGFKEWIAYCHGVGFQEVQDEPKEGDMLLFSTTGDGEVNHTGVYHSSGALLHQPLGGVSELVALEGAWRQNMVRVMRQKL